MKIYIKSISYLYENRKDKRELKITLSNKTVVRASACYKSWRQCGGTNEELSLTVPIVDQHNEWLHGGERP